MTDTYEWRAAVTAAATNLVFVLAVFTDGWPARITLLTVALLLGVWAYRQTKAVFADGQASADEEAGK